MKRILMYAAALLAVIPSMAEMRQAVILHTGDSQIVYYLEDEPQITFDGQQMVVTVDGKAESLPMESIDHWTIGMADYTAIPTIDVKAPAVHVNGGEITVINPNGEPINIYNLTGVQVAASYEDTASFHLDKGIYVITVGNKSFKIKN